MTTPALLRADGVTKADGTTPALSARTSPSGRARSSP